MAREFKKYSSKSFLNEDPDEFGTICTSIEECDWREGVTAEIRLTDCSKIITLDFGFSDIESAEKRVAKVDLLLEELKAFKKKLQRAAKLLEEK